MYYKLYHVFAIIIKNKTHLSEGETLNEGIRIKKKV